MTPLSGPDALAARTTAAGHDAPAGAPAPVATMLPGGAGTAYPPFPQLLPDEVLESQHYQCRFACDAADLEAIQRLRFAVFNLELNEGLAESHLTGRDQDDFDPQCHHLMTVHRATGAVVGTYRLQLPEMAQHAAGFYSATEFDLSTLPDELLRESVEIGRACIAKAHRNTRVLHLLWQGLLAYLRHNQRHYLFGCSSVTTQDPAEAARVLERLARGGSLHPTLTVQPRPECACVGPSTPREGWERARIPILFSTYLRHGARICGPPAIDRRFGTVDFFTWIDVESVDTTHFESDRRSGADRPPAPSAS